MIAKFIGCCDCQKNALLRDEKLAKQQVETLIRSIDLALLKDAGQYPPFTGPKLRKAKRIVQKSLKWLETATANCEKDLGKAPSEAIMWGDTFFVGKPHNKFWAYNVKAQAAILVHEATHGSHGTFDYDYFWQNKRLPSDTFIFGWDITASTYDTWIMFGFCIPGHNCAVKIELEKMDYLRGDGLNECL